MSSTEPTYDGHALPRDVSRYEPTTHFWQRLKYRKQPEPSKAIATETVEQGTIKRTHMADRFIFEQRVDGVLWWVLAAVKPEAFERDTAHHYLLSIYAPEATDGDHPEVFDVSGVDGWAPKELSRSIHLRTNRPLPPRALNPSGRHAPEAGSHEYGHNDVRVYVSAGRLYGPIRETRSEARLFLLVGVFLPVKRRRFSGAGPPALAVLQYLLR